MTEQFAVQLTAAPEEKRRRWVAARGIAMRLGVPLGDAQAMLDHLPARYPARWDSSPEARAALGELESHGVTGAVVSASHTAPCHDHAELPSDEVCAGCEVPLCGLCAALVDGDPRCAGCRAKAARSRRFLRLRVSVLLSILAGVLLYAYADVRQRHLRTDWERTLTVSLVVVPKGPLDDAALDALERRVRALEKRLAQEMARYRQGPAPFDVMTTTMPYGLIGPPPRPPSDPQDWWGAIRFNLDLSRWVDEVDERAGLDEQSFDASIYLFAEDGDGRRTLTVEGTGQQGGRVGIVEVDLDEQMVDTTLFVVAHELFHILGANDKYDASGEPRVPDGLADPGLRPLYPQERAEVMARHRATSPTESVLPETLEELAVGPATAREVRWLAE